MAKQGDGWHEVRDGWLSERWVAKQGDGWHEVRDGWLSGRWMTKWEMVG